MSKEEYTLTSARDRLERNGIQVQGTAIFTSEKRPLGLNCWVRWTTSPRTWGSE
jgi:hypothetical protein